MKVLYLILISVFTFLISCKKNISLANLNGDAIGCFGHAGMGSRSVYPANSLESLETCLSKGADGTEMDVQVTKDSVLVIFHNADLSGTTKCGGIVRNMNWDEISACRINSTLFKHLDVISFDEFMKGVADPFFYTFTFDCKLTTGDGNDNEYYQRFTSTIVRTVQNYGITQNVFIENSDPNFLTLIKNSNTDLKLFLLTEDYESGIKTAIQNKFYGLSMDTKNISADQIKDAHDQNTRITLYGVQSSKQNYSAVEKQPDYIQTDDLDYLLRIFGKLNRKGGLYNAVQNLK